MREMREMTRALELLGNTAVAGAFFDLGLMNADAVITLTLEVQVKLIAYQVVG